MGKVRFDDRGGVGNWRVDADGNFQSFDPIAPSSSPHFGVLQPHPGELSPAGSAAPSPTGGSTVINVGSQTLSTGARTATIGGTKIRINADGTGGRAFNTETGEGKSFKIVDGQAEF